MAVVSDVRDYLDRQAPFDTALSFDNCGILVGDPEAEVRKALVCLDVTEEIAEEAEQCGAELIVSHHPVIFHGMKRILKGDLVYLLIRKGLTVLSAHTNLDMAEYGVNYQLAAYCGIEMNTLHRLPQDTERQSDGFGLAGVLEAPMEPEEYALFIKQALSGKSVKFTNGGHRIKTAAVSCGAGSYLLDDVIHAGVDALVTAEVKHHELLAAKAAGLTVIDAGHYETEQVIITPLAEELAARFPEISFYTAGENPAQYV